MRLLGKLRNTNLLKFDIKVYIKHLEQNSFPASNITHAPSLQMTARYIT
jgi:hypothetical protein